MTYPDLVPAISGFTELFFIEVFVIGILFGRRARSRGRSGPAYRKCWKIAGSDILCPKIPGYTGSKTVYECNIIGGLMV